jgi:hypothetical protein
MGGGLQSRACEKMVEPMPYNVTMWRRHWVASGDTRRTTQEIEQIIYDDHKFNVEKSVSNMLLKK